MFSTLADYTVVPYLIPNQPENADGIELFIQRTEKEQLQSLLGFTFYKLLEDGISALPADWSPDQNYGLDALVVSGKNIYKSLQVNNTNHAVTDPAWWEVQPLNKWLLLKVGDTYLDENGFENTWLGMKAMCMPMTQTMYHRNPSMASGVGQVQADVENAKVVETNALIAGHWRTYNEIAAACENSLFGYLMANSTQWDSDVEAKGYRDLEHYLDLNFEAPGSMNEFDF